VTALELQSKRSSLLNAIAGGELRVQDGRRSIEYRSTSDMERALARIDREIAALSGTEKSRRVVITPKGL
jgi:hypothetical protein